MSDNVIRASQQQINFFDELLNEKEFPEGTDADALREKFATLSKRNASEWVEKAIALPKKSDSEGTEKVEAPF